jgi:hypothetical protein
MVELLEWLDNAGITLAPSFVETSVQKIDADYNTDRSVQVAITVKPDAIPWPDYVRDAHLTWTME